MAIYLTADDFASLSGNETLTNVSIAGVVTSAWAIPQSTAARTGIATAVVVPETTSGAHPTLSVAFYTPTAGRVIQPTCVNYLPHATEIPDAGIGCFVAVAPGTDSFDADAGQIETASAFALVPSGNISAGDVYVINVHNGGANTAGVIDFIGAWVTFP
ncbi:MAG: hypothetical protein ABR567_16125 [Myxococcales bacterium]|nr:hypothetical protein [Myxococcales bacterium]